MQDKSRQDHHSQVSYLYHDHIQTSSKPVNGAIASTHALILDIDSVTNFSNKL
jgi:hypothetical protein